jgi:hypothetical protein
MQNFTTKMDELIHVLRRSRSAVTVASTVWHGQKGSVLACDGFTR